MKKKFVLTLALVLMVAAAVVAAPLEIKGEFSAGRTFTFKPLAVTSANNVKLAKVSASTDFWKVSIDGGAVSLDGGMTGVADIYLDKALAEQGMDLGDMTMTLSVGNKGGSGILSVYADPNDSLGGLSAAGTKPNTTELTVGYDMVTVKAGLVFNTATDWPLQISAKLAPVDGVTATVGFVSYVSATETKGGIGGSVKIDVAALADLDFDLAVSVYDKYLLEGKDNTLFVAAEAGFGDISADAEFIMGATNDLLFNASYSGIENVGLSAGLTMTDLSNIDWAISGAVDYTMGGVKYKLAAEYDGALTLKPSVTIKF
ncbi:MAG: hypothetical protein VB010_00270 [Sphaerochaeta associata]|uniref:hypothetical protein n=1 Tax=Sphaerochaeta associata TaxID=1129264 RepID=UPI002B1F7021|nr:hypothetical protein [Sphaerochaeta associata]MEA5105771.1 hypothetical protein [Sphaerochaeta associata]